MGWLDQHTVGKKFTGCAQTFVSWMCRNNEVPTAQLAWEKQLDTWNYQPFFLATQTAQSNQVALWGTPMSINTVPQRTTTNQYYNDSMAAYDGAYASTPMDVGGVVRRMAAEMLGSAP